MFKKNVISKKLFFVLGVILSIFVLCTNGERDNVLDAGGSNYSTPVSITVKADKDTVYINESVILKLNCDNESILDNFIWKTGKEEKKTVEDSIIYAWKKEGLKIISVYSVDKLTRESKVVFCTVFVELGKPVVELNSDTITSYIYDTVKCTAHATDNGTIKKYNWTTNIKNIEMSNDSIQKIVSKDTGLFFVIVSVEDNDSVSSLADTCVVIIKEGKPKAQIEFDTSIIEIRETVTISVDTSDENGVIKKFIWEYTSKNRDSTVHDTTKPGSRDFVWNDTGFVTISVIAVDDDGLFSETSRCTIYVDIGPKPTVLLDSNIVNSYINDSTTITATGSDENGTVTGFLWKEAETGKTYSTVDGQFSFVWREAGTRKITVQAVDNDGQLSDYDTCVIYIDSGIPVAIAHPNTIGSTTRQDGITVTLEAKDNNLEGELVWFWDTGSPGWDDSTSGPTRTFTSSNGGVITIIWAVRDDDNLFSKKDTFQISFNSPPCSTEIIEPKEVAQWNSFNKNSGTGSVKCIWTFDDPDSASDIKRCKLLIRNDYGTTMYTFQRDVSSSTFDTILTFATLSKYTWNMVVYDNFGDSAQSSGSFTTSFGSPVISEDPIGSTVFKGDTVTFSVIAEGNELLYQWYIDGTYAIPSANKAQYSLNNVDYADSIHEYYCIVSNPTGSDTSETVSIRVLPVKPVIDSIHYDTTVTQSEGAVFTVFASGEFLEYQWQKNGADILVDGSVLTIDSVALADNGSQFRCIVSNAGGSDTSEVMTLEVALATPVIISNPSDTTVAEGNRICLKVEAIGDNIKYQRQKNGVDLPGKTFDTLVILSAQMTDSGYYRCIVYNNAGSDTSDLAFFNISNFPEIIMVALGDCHSLVLKTTGTVYSFGDNEYGQLGDGTTTSKFLPTKIIDNVQKIAAGDDCSFFLKEDGTLWACGLNEYGQLGDGTTSNRLLPVFIIDNVKNIAVSGTHSMVIKNDNSLWGWGANWYGELGDGTTKDRKLPVKIMDSVQIVAAGNAQSLFLKIDNSLWVCGYNEYGQLCDGTTTSRITPKKIMENVTSVSTGSFHSLILKSDKTMWACGHNTDGQLGNGTTIHQISPIRIMDNVIKISAGHSHSFILKTDYSLWACGSNWKGQLGDGTSTNRLSPVKIMEMVQSVFTGSLMHSFILKKDGTLWACGYNKHGQLGDGTTTDRHTPVQITIP